MYSTTENVECNELKNVQIFNNAIGDANTILELNDFDYLMRIDDDSWFKEKLEFDFFDELDKRNGMFGTGFTWNHFNPNHLQTRHDLFNWIKYYVDKYSVDVKNQQLKESLNGSIDNELFHTQQWNCGNCNVYKREM